ncbi:MAG: hypothetical protein MMC23_005617 [Stictis urceolatum]|nr:hypothetical protein [Stictis urceolata]
MFLSNASSRDELDFSFHGLGVAAKSSLLCGTDRVLFTFGLDWVGVVHTDSGQECAIHELQIEKRKQMTKENSRATPGLWEVKNDWNLRVNNEATTVTFLSKLAACFWLKVVGDWHDVLDWASGHTRVSEKQALRECIGVTEQEHLAQKTWRDALAWKTLRSLITAHLKAVTSIKTEIETLALVVDISLDSGAFEHVMGELEDMREVLSEFESRGRDISDLVYNIISVRNAEASQNYARDIGRLTWITFIFFPLIVVSVRRSLLPRALQYLRANETCG